MRHARQKVSGRGCYYHLFNRIAGCSHEHPFTDVDREYGIKLAVKLADYYLLDFISLCWMGNHFHVVLYAPSKDKLPSDEVIAQRHNNYYGNRPDKLIDSEDSISCAGIGEKMIDISHFMKVFQQSFVAYYNKSHNRRGHLWSGRFKSTILDMTGAVWAAVKYVELNPVRAGLVNDPADYRHSTWGWLCGSGKHLFASGFFRHMRRCMPLTDFGCSDQELIDIFNGELTRTIAYEIGQSGDELYETVYKARKGVSMPLRCLRRTRHWTDGGIIGSKEFIHKVAGLFTDDMARMKRKQFSCGRIGNGGYLYCYKRL